MRKKYIDNSDEENEFDVDEPEEIQNNASDDDWTPDKDTSGGRRQSTRLRSIPRSRAPIIDASSTDEDNSDDSEGGKRKSKSKSRVRPPTVKKPKLSKPIINLPIKAQTENGGKSVNSDSEPSSTTNFNTNSAPHNTSVSASPTGGLSINKEFTSGAFVVLKTDAANLDVDPALWKIDGKALLQKYIPFEQDGKTFYKNTSVYSGWTIVNKDNYYPVKVIFKQQTRKEHIVEFRRDQLKLGVGGEEDRESSVSPSPEIIVDKIIPVVKKDEPKEKPLIKVKSFAIVPPSESKTPATPIIERLVVPQPPTSTQGVQVTRPQICVISPDYAPGSFLVLRKDAPNVDPPLWKIDGRSLLQRFNPFKQNGKTLYKNAAEYCGWSIVNKCDYYPVTVIFKQQIKKDQTVELDKIKWDEPDSE